MVVTGVFLTCVFEPSSFSKSVGGWGLRLREFEGFAGGGGTHRKLGIDPGTWTWFNQKSLDPSDRGQLQGEDRGCEGPLFS